MHDAAVGEEVIDGAVLGAAVVPEGAGAGGPLMRAVKTELTRRLEQAFGCKRYSAAPKPNLNPVRPILRGCARLRA